MMATRDRWKSREQMMATPDRYKSRERMMATREDCNEDELEWVIIHCHR
jgi:hypothetical protein